jgi:hypothetical protein
MRMRYLLFVAVVLIVACNQVNIPPAAPVHTPSGSPDVVTPKAAPTEQGVTRVLSSTDAVVGAPVTVQLYVNLNPGETYYLFDENVSKGLRATDRNLSPDNHLRVVVLQDAVSTIERYSVVADAPGSYILDGEYAIEGNVSIQKIKGDSILVVR